MKRVLRIAALAGIGVLAGAAVLLAWMAATPYIVAYTLYGVFTVIGLLG